MDQIVIIGASSLQVPLVIKAKEKGYETHVFAWEEGAVAKQYCDCFYPFSITEKEKIYEQCKLIQPKAVVSIASDLAVITVNYVARRLGLVCNPEITDLISTNKYEMRKAFEKYNVPIPNYIIADDNFTMQELRQFTYPLIVKATDRSGSRGVTKVMCAEEVESAIIKAKKESFEHKAIIEEFVEGTEYSCECISYQGYHHFLAFTKKYTTGAPAFIEVAHLEPADIPFSLQKHIISEVYNALNSLSIQYGASHAEFKIQEDGSIKFIEIGSRMGGDHIGSDLVEISTGYDYVGMVIDIAAGKELTLDKKKTDKYGLVKFVFNQEDYEELQNIIRQQPKILHCQDDIEIEPDKEITDSSKRYGCYVLACESLEQALRYLPE